MTKEYDLLIVGGGVSGTALLFVASKYTNLKSVALVEKYSKPAQVSSHSRNNSQTLHFGDIETNYTVEKAASVKQAADMVRIFAQKNKGEKRALFKFQKMVLAVGEEEVKRLDKRYAEFKPLFPNLQKLDRKEIKKWEPTVVKGRDEKEKILALGTKEGYAVDFEALSQMFLEETKKNSKLQKSNIDTFFSTEVKSIKQNDKKFEIDLGKEKIIAKSVVVSAGAHSLLIARSMGHGKDFSTLPIDGNFYFTKNQMLNGKVYTMQIDKLPFAAVHGDPDVKVPGKTRFGPTAKVMPVLESGKFNTISDFFKSAGLLQGSFITWIKLLTDTVMLKYILNNLYYEIPGVGKESFAKYARKIIPTIKASDLEVAKGFGGIRPQVIDNKERKLVMGEGKIRTEGIIFNMTPSPGASTCLKNAELDAKATIKYLGKTYKFNTKEFDRDFK